MEGEGLKEGREQDIYVQSSSRRDQREVTVYKITCVLIEYQVIYNVLYNNFIRYMCLSICLEHGSPAFEEFLELIGMKVKMKGFSKYRAQLDNKSESRDRERGWGLNETEREGGV